MAQIIAPATTNMGLVCSPQSVQWESDAKKEDKSSTPVSNAPNGAAGTITVMDYVI